MARMSKTVKIEIPVDEIISKATDDAIRMLSITIEHNVKRYLFDNRILYSDIMKRVIEEAARQLAETGRPKEDVKNSDAE